MYQKPWNVKRIYDPFSQLEDLLNGSEQKLSYN